MEMENSLRQLDEYLEKIGRTEGGLEEQDSERVVQECTDAIEDINIPEKSKEHATKAEKSSSLEDNEESSPLLRDAAQKSSNFTRDFTPNTHNSIDSHADAGDSGDSVSGNGQVQADEDNYFGSETSVFRMSDNTGQSPFIQNVKSEALHFEESEEAVSELAEVGLCEESLQEFVLSAAQSSKSQKESSNSTQVHPVSLKKSTGLSEDSVAAQPPKGQVTTLLDLSSIGELKRLWTKSDKSTKKPGAQSIKQQADSKSSAFRHVRGTKKNEKLKRTKHASFIEEDSVQSTKCFEKLDEVAEIEPEIGFKRKSFEEKNTNRSTSQTKQCSVKLVRLEGILLPENLKIDFTMPKISTALDKGSDVFSKSFKQKAANKNCNKVKGSGITKVDNSLKSISSKLKGSKVVLKTKLKKASKAQKNYKGVKETATQIKSECIEMNGQDELDIENEDSNDDKGDDDYVPSDDHNDDDYNPKKNIKKLKVKKSNSANLKCKMVDNKQESLSSKVSVRSYRKKIKGTRIGRPPVFGHFECKFCDFTANEKNLVDKHHYKCHRMVLTCEYCCKQFKSVNGLLEHQAYKHDAGKPFKCEHEGCTYASKNPTDLQRHQPKHETELKYVCDICGWRTKWRRNMRHHHTIKHCDERNFKCTICEFAAKRSCDLKEHMYRHSDEKPIQCLVCGFRVKTNYELRSHMLVHSNEKPFKCTYPGCTGATKTRADLMKHMRVHQTERPFKCHICAKCYKDQHALNKHISGIHVAERKYKCDICGKSFKNRYALKKHMYLHAGHKPHACPVCQWKFSTRSNMEKHMVTHDTNERPYLCPLCPHAAKQPDHLLAHIGTVHGDKYAYFCELCNKPFKRYMQLKLHYERMHTKKEVERLKNSSIVDLALLKMEMKLELEEKEAGKKRKRKSTSKSKTLSDADIKEEPVDADYGNVNAEEDDISDVRLDEDTGEIKIHLVKKKSRVKKGSGEIHGKGEMVAEPNSDEVENMDEHEVPKSSAFEFLETLSSKTRGSSEVKQFVEDGRLEENTETEITIIDSDADNDLQVTDKSGQNSVTEEQKYDSEDIEKKKDSILIAKNNQSTACTVALYENFRLPLATRGFNFNYNKNGTKPMKAWFMDVSLMDRQTAEKHKKHRRRLGLLPPIPRGHPPKGYKRLKHFVDKRKKQLAENIKKAKFVKDLGLVSKRNSSRSKRFMGKYTEFETVDGEVLSVEEVQERLPKLEDTKDEKAGPAKEISKKKPAAKKTSKPTKDSKKSKVKSANSEKQNRKDESKAIIKKKPIKRSNNKKKGIAENKSSKKSKLLLSTEKKKKGKSSSANLKIRKPTFLEKRNAEISLTDSNNRNSFEALESILSEFSQSSSSTVESENTKVKKTARKQEAKKITNSKTTSVKAKIQKVKLSKKSNGKGQTEPKYNKKYKPVKQTMKRKKSGNESGSSRKKMKPTDVFTDHHIGVYESTSDGQNIHEHVFYPPNVQLPIQDSQLVMVYPTSVLQADNISESPAMSSVNVPVFANVSDNGAYVNEEAAQTERLELKRNLNDMLTDAFAGSGENASGHNSSGNSDKDLMQKEYTEAVLVKEEPDTDVLYYTSLAQKSTTV